MLAAAVLAWAVYESLQATQALDNELSRERIATLAKDRVFVDVAPDRFLFLDTETTGLSGGAGTVVFALGLAHLEPDAVVFEQTFLRDFGEEAAMLGLLINASELLAFGTNVSSEFRTILESVLAEG